MDEALLLTLIAEGEGTSIEFKRELHLDSASGKAEFIKDVIAIANASPNRGYILIGVDDNKIIVGISGLDDERLQQITHTYITPSVNLTVRHIPVNAPELRTVGVLQITALSKPCKVAQSIEQLRQNKVYIRHGSVVLEASPEEIIGLHQQSQHGVEVRQFIRAAETHARLGNFTSSIAAYSKAIEIDPDADRFLARGMAYRSLWEEQSEFNAKERSASLAHKDFSDAINLGLPLEKEKEARFGRLSVYIDVHNLPNPDQVLHTWNADLEWFAHNGLSPEWGKALVIEVDTYNDISLYIVNDPDESFSKLDKAIGLGYTDPYAFCLRAEASYFGGNYGLALKDIERAIGDLDVGDPLMAKFLRLRGAINAKSGRFASLNPSESFEQAWDDFQKAAETAPDTDRYDHHYVGFVNSHLEYEILYRYAISMEYSQPGFDNETKLALQRSIVQAIVSQLSRYGNFAQHHSKIMHTVRRIVGEEFWQANKIRLE